METVTKYLFAFCCLLFKSYYVVWKPEKKYKYIDSFEGLNRTM